MTAFVVAIVEVISESVEMEAHLSSIFLGVVGDVSNVSRMKNVTEWFGV